jgi:putative ABC transport system substrate-binding protein
MDRGTMRRREFLAALAGAMMVRPAVVRAQPARIPVIGFLSVGSPGPFKMFLAAFHQGLNARGYVEGRNVAVEYRWAEGDLNLLRQHAADLARREVAVIVATGGVVSAQAAKAVTQTIPILFIVGSDPVEEGLVSSISRPGGNATGVSLVSAELMQKRMELLHQLVPQAKKIAVLINPETPTADTERWDTQRVAAVAKLEVMMVEARAESQFEAAFASAINAGAGALLITPGGFYTSRRAQIIKLAASYRLPTAYPWREYAVDGGLMSYGPNVIDAYHQIGDYAGRVLAGTRPDELPVQLPTTFDLILNLKTASVLGIEVPPPLLISAAEVIE